MAEAWRRTEPTEAVKVGWRTVTQKTFVDPNGKIFKADVYAKDGEQGVAVIALTEGNEVIVCRQYRFGPERLMDELPGGFVDNGEDKKAAALRELAEETSYIAGSMEYLGYTFRDAWSNDLSHYYLATRCQLSPDGQRLDETEDIAVTLIPVTQLIQNARDGMMTDPAAVLMAYEKLKALEV